MSFPGFPDCINRPFQKTINWKQDIPNQLKSEFDSVLAI